MLVSDGSGFNLTVNTVTDEVALIEFEGFGYGDSDKFVVESFWNFD